MSDDGSLKALAMRVLSRESAVEQLSGTLLEQRLEHQLRDMEKCSKRSAVSGPGCGTVEHGQDAWGDIDEAVVALTLPDPRLCLACGQSRYWCDSRSGRRICRVCHPPPNLECEA